MNEYALRLDYKQQKEWSGAPMWLEMTFGALGSSLFLISMCFQYTLGAVIGVVLAVGGKGILLLGDLGRPERFFRVMTKPGNSWISKGAWGFLFFSVFGVLSAAPLVLTMLPWSPWSGVGKILGVLACIFAIFLMVYDGFFMALSKGVGFWHDGVLPVLFGASAALAGLGALELLSLVRKLEAPAQTMVILHTAAAALAGFCTYSILATANSKGTGAKISAELLTKGALSKVFWCGVLGILIPFLCGVLALAGFALPSILWALVGMLEIMGLILLRYSILRAGVYTPVR